MPAMAVTPARQGETVNYFKGDLTAREDAMIGNDLVVEIPWIVFGVLLAAVCVRLCRLRRFSDRQQDPEFRQRSEDGGDSSAAPARADELGADHHGWPTVSSSAHSTSPASPNQDPAAAGRQDKPASGEPTHRDIPKIPGPRTPESPSPADLGDARAVRR